MLAKRSQPLMVKVADNPSRQGCSRVMTMIALQVFAQSLNNGVNLHNRNEAAIMIAWHEMPNRL